MIRFKKMALLAPIAALGLMTTPAAAAGAGGGVVDGTVTISPGIPTTGSSNDTFTFASVVLTGALTDGTAAGTYAGTLSTGADGSAAGETLSAGAGPVNNVNPTGSTLGRTVSCTLSGSFTRRGPVVTVSLSGTCDINGHLGVAVSVTVVALFVPTTVNPVTKATFAGVWAGTTS